MKGRPLDSGQSAIVPRLLAWFSANARELPWRQTSDPYAIWISEIMLQQTQVKTVIPYWERWMRAFPNVASVARAPEARVLKLWEGLGYYRRARQVQAAARSIVERHDGAFPQDFEDVLALPGVGRYTAGAICSIAFDQPTPVLDGNVIRVLTRVGAIRGDPRASRVNRRLWREAEDLVRAAVATGEAGAASRWNQALMELGALICTPRAPVCLECPLADACCARREGRTEAFPQGVRPPKATPRWFVTIVANCGERFCVRQRPDHGVNRGLWEFPNEEVAERGAKAPRVSERLFGGLGTSPEPLGTVRHAITRYRVTQWVYRVRFEALTPRLRRAGEWRTRAELEDLAFTSAHRRILAWTTDREP